MDNYTYAIVGAGGIGHFLAPTLAKFLAFQHPGSKLTIVDADEIEDKNLSRSFSSDDVGLKKAEVLAGICAEVIPSGSLSISTVDSYLTPDNFDRFHAPWFKEKVVVFGCVDNHKSRAFMEKKLSELSDGILISAGNSFHEGQSQMYVRKGGEDITQPITQFSPDILDNSDPEDIFPDEKDCSVEYEEHPQLILANLSAAVASLNLFYSQCCFVEPHDKSINDVRFNILDGGAFHVFHRIDYSKTPVSAIQQ